MTATTSTANPLVDGNESFVGIANVTFKEFSNPFILYETHQYCLSMVGDIIRALKKCTDKEIIDELSYLSKSHQLINYPILAALLCKNINTAASLLDGFTQKPEGVLALAYFLNNNKVKVNIDSNVITEAKLVLEFKASALPSPKWMDIAKLSTDVSYAEKIVNEINNKTATMVQQYRKNMSNYQDEEWKRNSVFKGMTEDAILDKLSTMSMQELLINFNEALAVGIGKEDIKLMFEKCLNEGASVIPLKMCLGMYENMQLCIQMEAHKAMSKWGSTSEYKFFKKSKYYMGDYISSIMVNKATIQEKIAGKIVCVIDESGSQRSKLDGSKLPVDKVFFSAMMSYQLLLSASNVHFVFSGIKSDIRTETLLSPYKADFVEFWLDFDNKIREEDGIYEYVSRKFVDNTFSLTDKDLIIIFADSGDSDAHKTKAYYDKLKNTPTIYFNVESDHCNQLMQLPVVKFAYPTKYHQLLIGGYSSYWIEPIFRMKNVKSSLAKNMDPSGQSARDEF